MADYDWTTYRLKLAAIQAAAIKSGEIKPPKGASDVHIIDLFDAGLADEELASRNRHDCPVEKIAAMRVRWEKIKIG